MSCSNKIRARKATWLAFGVITLAAISSYAVNPEDVLDLSTSVTSATENIRPTPLGQVTEQINTQQSEQTTEAVRAYKYAVATLATLTAHPPSHSQESSFAPNQRSSSAVNSFISGLLPNLHGQGPIANAMRIFVKLQHHSWIRRLIHGIGKGKEGLGLGASRRRVEDMERNAIKVVDLLTHAAELGYSDALYTLAQISLFPPNTYFPSDPTLAYNSFATHASTTGNASSQAYLAFFHSTGYHEIVPADQAKAQLYYTFAAHGGDKGAQMALGYRYWSGIGTLEDCSRSLAWYESASEMAMAKFLSGPPGGRTLPQTPTRLSDLEGGIYGPGASVASTGLNVHRPAVKAGAARAAGETWEDVLEYYFFNADRGETDFVYRLGKIFYQGSIYASPGGVASGAEGVGAIPRDFSRAHKYFLNIAREVWRTDPANPVTYVSPKDKDPDHRDAPIGYAAACAGYLGRMYLRGEGVKQDFGIAKMWFQRGADYGDRESHNGLGIMWRDGLIPGKVVNHKMSVAHFEVASKLDLAEAQVNLGKYYYSRGETKMAMTFFETAMRHGSPFEAYYYLADIQGSQASIPGLPEAISSGSCSMAVSFHKVVAERGVWGDDLLRDAENAWTSGSDRGKEIAMLKWWIATERGSEIAQNNLAHALDQDKSILRLTRFSPITPSNDTARLALTQWTRAAAQRNIDALVKVGDYYYHGLGVSDQEPEPARFEKAARYYQSAADTQQSALAMWNLGWMYENGVGVAQDFHLAKRHYDMALETNAEAYLPVMLSLGKLYARSIWHTLTGGKGGLNLWDLGEEEQVKGSTDPNEKREIDGTNTQDTPASDASPAEERIIEEDDGPWYMGKAREQFHRRRQGQDNPNREEDPIQWALDRRHAEREREGDFGPEDDFNGALRTNRRIADEYDEDDEEFGDTVLLVLLLVAISALAYVRARTLERIRRAENQQRDDAQGQPPADQQQPAQRDQGVFPAEGDPARDEWVILH